uniref:Uncharacterized protein n=1 Tax=Caudovirales sp. ctlwr10 TaxID=2825771 RepID=A0A8S5Q5F4_9CAUD|nr:MAG TPA: hypothetical protein [Caudovirales sp. ctlwr10]
MFHALMFPVHDGTPFLFAAGAFMIITHKAA